jgi:hypothetical protein
MEMFKHKVGDTIRIQSQEWIDAQKKKDIWSTPAICKDGCELFVKYMFQHAGKIAKILKVDEKINSYKLDVDNGEWDWQDWMFDPDYKPDEEDRPLSAEDAIWVMLDGETLYDKNGNKYYWDKGDKCFYHQYQDITSSAVVHKFDGLCRRPVKGKRPMTQREAIDWARSKESWGWLVRRYENDIWREWRYPTEFDYSLLALKDYQRARLLPDLSGIDESTIQGFEVEE